VPNFEFVTDVSPDGRTGSKDVCRSGIRQLSFQEPGLELHDEVLIFGIRMVVVLWARLRSVGGSRQAIGGGEG